MISNILPMNAKSAGEKLQKLMGDPKYVAEVKIDGYRSICDNGIFYSRLGNDFTAKVPHLSEALKEHNVILDGELCMLDSTANSSDVTKILGSLPEKALARQEELGKLRYIIFDILSWDDESFIRKPWSHRRDELQMFFDVLGYSEYISISEYRNDKHSMLNYAESHGLEGIMLKNIDAPYVPNKRPEGHWYKVKKHMTYDVVCTGFTPGAGKYTGLVGAIEFGLYRDGELEYCGQCSGFSDDLRREITGLPSSFMGRVMEIKAMERTKDGNFRHPVFGHWRTDKSPKECLWTQC